MKSVVANVKTQKARQRQMHDSADIQNCQPIRELLKELFITIRHYVTDDIPITGVTTGLVKLDIVIGGLKSGNLYVIAGVPQAGKSALALSMAYRAAVENKPVTPTVLFSLDETKAELMELLISMAADIDFEKIRNSDLEESDWPKLTHGAGLLHNASLYINDTLLLTLGELCDQIRRAVKEHYVKVVYIDYLQLLQVDDRMAMRLPHDLKQLAQELGIAIVAIAQLNSPPIGSSRRPRISDLGRYGNFKLYADVIMLLHRKKATETDGITELVIAKNSRGIGTIEIRFLPEIGKYVDFESESKG